MAESIASNILPWQEPAWERLQQRLRSNRLAHGLLITAPAGSGAEDFARELATSLLGADNERGRALLAAGSHPDLFVQQPEEEGKAIKVDALRALIEFVNLTAQYGNRKVALILQAEAMNRHAANMLLKTLEEPPPQSTIILVSQQPALLPITIRSRCQMVTLTASAGAATQAWLQDRMGDSRLDAGLLLRIAGGAPLAARDLTEATGLPLRDKLINDMVALRSGEIDAVAVVERWNGDGAAPVFGWLEKICRDCARCLLLGPDAVVNRDQAASISRLTSDMSLRQVMNYYDLVIKNHHLLTGPTNPNSAVLLEDFVLQWQGAAEG